MFCFLASAAPRALRLALAVSAATGCGAARQAAIPSSLTDTVQLDPCHPAPRDTLLPAAYDGWKQYRLLCDRCHGEDARGTTFGPDLLPALSPTGSVPDQATFVAVLITGRPARGMAAAATLGLQPAQFSGLYTYLKGRSAGDFLGGQPALRAQ